MAPFRRWADLPPDLLCRVGDLLDLKWYANARGVCTAWRRALAPPAPALLVVADDALRAASLPTRRSFELSAIVSCRRFVVGSSNGWLAFSVILLIGHQTIFVLVDPIAAVEIFLPPLIYETRWPVSKVVFAPRPAKDDFAAAAICDLDRVAYVTAGARRWAVMEPIRLTTGDHLTDLVYTDQGNKVYCLTKCGDVHVLRLPESRRRKRDKAPATVEPLLSSEANPATVFAPPYVSMSALTSAKNLVICEGNLYQVWRNATCCTLSLQLPGAGGRRHRVAENEILVLRYYPQRQPCWDVVKDLGGYSLFVGTNNAVSMYAEGVPGLRGNCVYWIGGSSIRDQGMVFDMESGRSTLCRAGFLPGHYPCICWYFLSDVLVSNKSSSCISSSSSSSSTTTTTTTTTNGGRKVYQTRARTRAEKGAMRTN